MGKFTLLVFVLAIAVCVLAESSPKDDQQCKRIGRRCTDDASCCKKLHCSKRVHRCLPGRPKGFGLDDEVEDEVEIPEDGQLEMVDQDADGTFKKCFPKGGPCVKNYHCCEPFRCDRRIYRCVRTIL